MGTFSSRIKVTYAIGLITKEQLLDLECLRKIRNEFAHTWKPVDISKQNIAALIENMAFSRIDDRFPETPVEKLRSSMICLLVEIRSSTHQIKKQCLQAKLVGNHLMRGFFGDFETQIQSAREELDNIVKNLDGAEKTKRRFYQGLLIRFKDRLTVLAKPEAPEQKIALAELLEEFTGVLKLAELKP